MFSQARLVVVKVQVGPVRREEQHPWLWATDELQPLSSGQGPPQYPTLAVISPVSAPEMGPYEEGDTA